ncbi:tetratricopeptide repeat protein [Candidatus Bathyarchaeota archaeon]|nr:tetratricopeptide repeat protein [Candidatus Bathyarchaeota archaeon]
MGGTLTVSERIQYHLRNYAKFEEKYEVPFDITQDGISQACSISRAHAAIELKKLKSAGLIDERLSHVRRGKTRRKAYFLTQKGKAKAERIGQYVSENTIDPHVDAGRVVPVVNGSRARSARKSTPLPQVRRFYGRKRELGHLRRKLADPAVKVISIRGMAGMGKTTLAAKLASESPALGVFWHSVKPWDVQGTLLDSLSEFFLGNGCRKLHSYMSSGDIELGELSMLLREELSENGYVFFLDDADCSEDIQDLLKLMKDCCGVSRIVITSEGLPLIYDSSDVVARKEVAELELQGLDRKAGLRILEERGISGEVAEKLVSITRGHPLSLEMITTAGLSEAKSQVARFLEEKFYTGLSEPEKALMQLASVFEKPFSSDAIPKDLRSIRRGSMLRESAPGRFELHSSLKDFLYSSMDPSDRAHWHSIAADHYLRVDDHQERIFHLIMSGRSLEAEIAISRLGDELLDDGDVQRLDRVLTDFEPRKDKYSGEVALLKARVASIVGDYERALNLLETIASSASGQVKAEAMAEIGRVRSEKGDLEVASEIFSEALEHSENAPSARAKALRGLGVVKNKLGDFEAASELLESSARDSMSVMDSKGMLLAHMELGNLFMGRGMYDDAISHFSKCAAGFGPVDLATVYLHMGVACDRLGRPEEARLHLENAVKLSSETGQPRSRARALISLAEVLSRSGDLDEARECCFSALEILTELDDKLGVSEACARLGTVERVSGDLASSEERYRESLKALEGLEFPRESALRRSELAAVLSDKGDFASACTELEEAAREFERSGAGTLAEEAREKLRPIRAREDASAHKGAPRPSLPVTQGDRGAGVT